VTRLCCAKQAILKALNCGVPDQSGSLEVCGADPQSGLVTVKLGSPLGELFPEWRLGALIAHTAREGDLVLATSFCERAPS
jgi:hypothetical protein